MILTVKDIVQMLVARVDSYVKFLLPNGKQEGAEWVSGSVGGEEGNSLKVRLTGEKAGVWADFASNDKGDLIGLTMAVKGVAIGPAIQIAKDWLGVRDPKGAIPPKSYSKPKPKGILKEEESTAVFEYLAQQRNIDTFTQSDFKIRQSLGKNGPEIVFPYIGPDGELVNVKRIAIKRTETGKKFVTQEAGCAPSLFGWHTLKPDTREVIITEGEIDAMTWYSIGFPALSIPDGAEGSTWVDKEWENLQQFDRIWLNWDNDAAGQKVVKEFARRLGYARCFILTLPGYKDANEALVANQPAEFFASAIAASKPVTPEQIKNPSDFTDRVIDKFYPPNDTPLGFFTKLFDKKLGMRPGELTLWSGISGHGKSAILQQLMLEAIIFGSRVAIGSFEMLPEQTLHRMLCQSEGQSLVRKDRIGPMLDWLSGKLWIYDLLGNVSPKMILELLEYSYSRNRVDIFVIDSLMKCSVGSEDYDAQRIFLNDLCSFAKDTRTHINLVAHARKGRDEMDQPGKLDVKGSSDIINQADNILTVWRNKDKESDAFNGKQNPDAPDTVVFCNKQRENGTEFKEPLAFMKYAFAFRQMKKEVQNISIWDAMNPEIVLVPETQATPQDML